MKSFFFCFLLAFFLVSAALATTRPIIDSDGKVVICEKPFQRIISLYGAHTRNLIDMGAGSQIVAVGRSDKQLPGLPTINFGDNPEGLVSLRTEHVLIRPTISQAHPKLARRL